jgi:chorismate mutase
MGGKRELIAPISQQALDMGFDGLIIESHCDPDSAWSDKSQQITPAILSYILTTLVLRDQNDPNGSLSMLRQQIDRLDNELLETLNKRMGISREIGEYKKINRIPVLQTSRYDEIMQSRVKLAEEMGMSREFMTTVLSAIHEESVRQQINILNMR